MKLIQFCCIQKLNRGPKIHFIQLPTHDDVNQHVSIWENLEIGKYDKKLIKNRNFIVIWCIFLGRSVFCLGHILILQLRVYQL